MPLQQNSIIESYPRSLCSGQVDWNMADEADAVVAAKPENETYKLTYFDARGTGKVNISKIWHLNHDLPKEWMF